MFDAGLWRCSSPAVMAANQNHICMAFRDARCDGSDADFRDELYADTRVMIGILEIMDQLRQIFDGIDVVVRRRRNQTDAWSRVTHLGDPWIDFSARQLATFSRLCTLGHLDLQFPRLRQVITGHAKSPRSNLFDGAIARIAIGIRNVTCRIFTPLAGIALPANAVHRDGEGFVRLLAYRAVGHGAGLEAFYDLIYRFHLFN